MRKKGIDDLNSEISVSIVTPTTKQRKEVLSVLLQCIKRQTFKVDQWVIVSGDKKWNEEDFNVFITTIQKDIPMVKIDSMYVSEKTSTTYGISNNYEAIGYLRNVTNKLANGDIIVCMDDDDYYPPTRVEHAVTELLNSNLEVAGCSPHLIYDIDMNTLFKFTKFSENHSVNCCLAYKKSFLITSNYDNRNTHAEESVFLKNFTIPIIQLDPMQTIIQMVHPKNTYNKRHLIILSHWLSYDKKNLFIFSKKPEAYIPNELLLNYKTLLYPDSLIKPNSKYDIVYYLGFGAKKWSPLSNSLGGSEQAVAYLSNEWVKKGLKVAVYGDFDIDFLNSQKLTDDVPHYRMFTEFKCCNKYNNLILWRNFGLYPINKYNLTAKKIFFDVHDINTLPFDNNVITHTMVKSKYHAHIFQTNNSTIPIDSIHILKNGVRKDIFCVAPTPFPIRDPYRMCWCSCYKRGLENILKWLFPIIKELEPRASLHVYYGMNEVQDESFKLNMTQLLSQPGVIDHGRQDVNIIKQEKYVSSYHLYYSITQSETDCISIRESVCSGCIPILSKYNVFQERVGIHIDGDPRNKEDMKKVARIIANVMNNTEQSNKIRKQLSQINDQNWKDIALAWSSIIKT